MKLLLENWKKYTASILNEDLLVESSEDAYETIKKRSAKLLKGWAYEKAPQQYNEIEENIQGAIAYKLGNNPSQEELNKYTNAWEFGGIIIADMIKNGIIPNDITDKQKSIALLWNYKQLTKNSIVDLDTFLNKIVEYLQKGGASIFSNLFGIFHNVPEIRTYFSLSFAYAYMSDDPESSESDIRRSKLIENFFHWNRFIKEGKKDLNSVSDYGELLNLVEEAKTLYQAWQENQNQKDAEAGKELLLDDEHWQIIAIHNKGAACQLGKGTEWCTAAPGLNYFQQYYKPNDPLFYILDKSDGEKYQFHFGTEQYMDKDDNNLYPSRYHVADQIMTALSRVVPEKYNVARKYLNRLSL
jgi:hypothetical protein